MLIVDQTISPTIPLEFKGYMYLLIKNHFFPYKEAAHFEQLLLVVCFYFPCANSRERASAWRTHA